MSILNKTNIILSVALLYLCLLLPLNACNSDSGNDTILPDGDSDLDTNETGELDEAEQEPDSEDSLQGDSDLEAEDNTEADLDAEIHDADINWVGIPAGSYEMGCSINDEDCQPEEYPRHPVTISPFEISETEITQAQYESVMQDNPSFFPDCQDCPAEGVDFDQATEFCEKVGGRLPSESEWEYAARAGATTRYYCGDEWACLYDIAWVAINSDGITHPVAQLPPNDFGLYDMLGNVWEWCADCRHDNFIGAPQDNGIWGEEGGGDCYHHIIKGGSFNDYYDWVRLSSRDHHFIGHSGDYVGFRCAR